MADARTVPVLMHHHVSPSPGMITVSPENFESQIAWLAEDGWTSLTLAQYAGFLAGKPVPRKSIVITFDDGYLDNWVYAHPILQKYGMRATVFVVTGWMGDGPLRPHAGQPGAALPATPDHRGCEAAIYQQGRSDDVMMRWSEARAATEAGTFEVHCHTHSHTRWLRMDISREERRRGIGGDLSMARQVLQEKMGGVSDTLCWPYGDFDQDYIEVAREQGFRYLHTTHPFGRNVVGGDPEHIYRFAIRNRPASWLRKRIRLSYNPVIGPLFNGFKARQKKMVPGP
ncbi:polysaccharide deacetylase family protein [Stenotrophomonas sp. 24(2023)]|uniref:polysaccharide deacetylase family protein n=1 Tax=Stenotrophomonas sp. 24(2023) TaxID=3068324 RepID=UPI0027E05851|nr:polysaccharide deacetylase family protein [Stenotrophomonas sp. 24(2023)]WMJ69947.1 polysaccharide deacetylase family protein [Stenotrophomonas sp. 24(2023)]